MCSYNNPIVGKWVGNSTIVSGLAASLGQGITLGYNITGDGNWTMIRGTIGGTFLGYYWNGNKWISDSSRIAGLTDVGDNSYPCVAFNVTGDGNWTLIVGEYAGTFNGYYWNGSQWVSDSSRVNGLGDVGYHARHCIAYNVTGDGKWTLISGEEDGVWNGYYWNGNQWVSDNSRVAGLTDVGLYSCPTIGYNVFGDNKWTLLTAHETRLDGYYWNGTQWVSDNSRALGVYSSIVSIHPCLVFNLTGDDKWDLFLSRTAEIPKGYSWRWGFFLNLTCKDATGQNIDGTVIMNNGTQYISQTEDGFVSFQTMNTTVKVRMIFQDVIVNETLFTLTDDKTFDLNCRVYSLTVKVMNIAGFPIPNMPLELYRNNVLLNGLYSLPDGPVTNESGMFTWNQLAYQTSSYTVVIPGATSQTTTLTNHTMLTITLYPPKPPTPPKPSPTPSETIIEAWTKMSPEQKTAIILGGSVIIVMIVWLIRNLRK